MAARGMTSCMLQRIYKAEATTIYDLLDIARKEQRILITDDKDFGELIFRKRLATSSIVLFRLRSPSIVERLERLAEVWPALDTRDPGARSICCNQRSKSTDS